MTTNNSQQHMEEWFAHMPQSGISEHLSPTFISCDWAKKTATIAFPVSPWQLNPQRVLHGGFTATAIHFTMELLVAYFAKGIEVSQISSGISYQKPIFKGDTFHVVARLQSQRNDVFHLQGEAIIPERGALASSATAIYSANTPKKGGVL